eukprot:COSAG02_NODE_679_length_18565_cov_57.795245_16_plen_127_part_00
MYLSVSIKYSTRFQPSLFDKLTVHHTNSGSHSSQNNTDFTGNSRDKAATRDSHRGSTVFISDFSLLRLAGDRRHTIDWGSGRPTVVCPVLLTGDGRRGVGCGARPPLRGDDERPECPRPAERRRAG